MRGIFQSTLDMTNLSVNLRGNHFSEAASCGIRRITPTRGAWPRPEFSGIYDHRDPGLIIKRTRRYSGRFLDVKLRFRPELRENSYLPTTVAGRRRATTNRSYRDYTRTPGRAARSAKSSHAFAHSRARSATESAWCGGTLAIKRSHSPARAIWSSNKRSRKRPVSVIRKEGSWQSAWYLAIRSVRSRHGTTAGPHRRACPAVRGARCGRGWDGGPGRVTATGGPSPADARSSGISWMAGLVFRLGRCLALPSRPTRTVD